MESPSTPMMRPTKVKRRIRVMRAATRAWSQKKRSILKESSLDSSSFSFSSVFLLFANGISSMHIQS